MKDKTKMKKILLAMVAIILVVGIVMGFTVGFNKSLVYKKGTKIESKINQGYQREEIETIAKESFPNRNIEVQDLDKLNQVFAVKLENYTKEELDNFKGKLAEKYDVKKDKLQIEEVKVPATRISTLVKPYIFPVALVSVLSAVYVAARGIKNKQAGKNVLQLIGGLAIALGIYFSCMMITRIPFGPETMPLALTVYVIVLLGLVTKLEK